MPLFPGSSSVKKIAQKTRKCYLRRATNAMFSKFGGWQRKKLKHALHTVVENRAARGFNSFINSFGAKDSSYSKFSSLVGLPPRPLAEKTK